MLLKLLMSILIIHFALPAEIQLAVAVFGLPIGLAMWSTPALLQGKEPDACGGAGGHRGAPCHYPSPSRNTKARGL
jgi:hypothetical protein